MILLKEIRLRNFLSHSDTSLKFAENTKVLLDGVSGAGKSSIVDALLWGLYGKGRTDNRSLIKRGADTVAVQILLKDGDKEYRVERQYTKAGKQNLDIAEKVGDKYVPIKIVGIKFMQEFIETKILKSSYLLFINSIAYPQDNQENFVKQTAEKRKDIILEIIKASDYDVYYDKAKEALKNLEVKTAALEVEQVNVANEAHDCSEWVKMIPNYESSIRAQKELVTKIEADIEFFEKKKKADDEANQKRFEINAQNSLLATSKAQAEAKIQTNTQSIKTYESLNLGGLQVHVSILNGARNTLAACEVEREKVLEWDKKRALLTTPAFYDWQPTIDGLIAKANKISEEPIRECSNPSCPYASTIKQDQANRIEEINKDIAKYLAIQKTQKTDKENFETAVEALGPRPPFNEEDYRQVKAIIAEKIGYETELNKYANVTADIKRLQEENTKLQLETIDIQQKIYANEEALKLIPVVNPATEEELRTHRANLTTAQLGLQRFELDLERALEFQKKSVILGQKLADINTQLKAVSGDQNSLELIKTALGNKGIKSIIIDYVIPQLEDKINEVLSKLSDFRVALETQKEGVGGDTIIDGLFITITNGQGETFDLASYSGGEKMRITTAISEGLASLQKTGFRIFDESIIGLDSATVEGFTEILIQIQNNFSQIMCISHLDPIKDLFEERITVIKKQGDSFVEWSETKTGAIV